MTNPELKRAPKPNAERDQFDKENMQAWNKNNDLLSKLDFAFLHYPKQKMAARNGDESILIYPSKNYKTKVLWVKGQGKNQKKENFTIDNVSHFVEASSPAGLLDSNLMKRLNTFPSLKTKTKALYEKAEAKRIKENTEMAKNDRALHILTVAEYKEFIALKKKTKRTAKEQARIDKLSIKVMTTPVSPIEKQIDAALRIMRRTMLSMPLNVSNPAHLWVNNRIMNIRTGFQSQYFMMGIGANYMAGLAMGKSLLERLLENNNKKATPAQKKKLKKQMSEIDRLTRDLE